MEFNTSYTSYAKSVIDSEISSLNKLRHSIGKEIDQSLELLLNCKGRVIVSGMGKSGLIGKKIAATLSSTGTPSFFLHPAEALHGDLGVVRKEDVFFSISNSGASDELLRIVPFIKNNRMKHICLTGNVDSLLASHADVVLDISIDKEACPLQLAPMSSTTLTLVMGDVLAACLMDIRDFKAESFAVLHPAGALGKKLLTTVKEEMRSKDLPVVLEYTEMEKVIYEISHGQLGLVCVVNDKYEVKGLITDGDLRRGLEKKKEGIFKLTAGDIMSKNPISVSIDSNISEVENILKEKKIKAVLVTDNNKLTGVFEYNGVL